MGAILQPGDIVASHITIRNGRNGNVIRAGTYGIVVDRLSQKIAVQFEKGDNETTEPLLCLRSNLRLLS
ncbi:MAG: hypothetical protein Greene071421_127 [Parcubacteria group bacterium Greene0714_21]|nr:MAG: hypothetical protein Greene041639_224 [Parcubacteria group bacterium Greene0416_39]TSC98530.1 MAG: hypothetical protein Greene101447_32 [Parcubacteria group bacterium Greene1014_47]TSD04291.1 MAG: hypothetical protein Greene071421_127 [Parcubacteria group bacterium Greene0714_21]